MKWDAYVTSIPLTFWCVLAYRMTYPRRNDQCWSHKIKWCQN